MTKPAARPDPPMEAGEREQLTGFLDYQRATVVWKCSGLTDEQARRSHLPSELTTIAGLLRHLTLVEEYWFPVVLDGQPDSWEEALKEDPDAEFRIGPEIRMADLLDGYEKQCEISRAVVAARDLEDTVPFRDEGRVSVRWVIVHMIEETARHAGHLDLLRELTDGLTGE